MMTKYTMAFLLAGIVGGIVLTSPRSLLNKWLWCGAAVGLLIFLPNLIWQVRHDFITLEVLGFIHLRDVRMGRADGFLPAQFWATTNCVTVPIWIAGLYFLFFKPEGKRYDRLDVPDPAGNPAHRQRSALLSRASLSHAARRGRRLGRALVANPLPRGCRHHAKGSEEPDD